MRMYSSEKDDPKEIKDNTQDKTGKDKLHIVLIEISKEDDGKNSAVDHEIEERSFVECDQQFDQEEDDRYYQCEF